MYPNEPARYRRASKSWQLVNCPRISTSTWMRRQRPPNACQTQLQPSGAGLALHLVRRMTAARQVPPHF